MNGASPEALLARNILLFGRVLRAAGLEVHHGRLIDAIRALDWIGVRTRTDVAATLRSLLVHDADDLYRFDRAFDAFFRAHRRTADGLPLLPMGAKPRVVVRPATGAPVRIETDHPQRAGVPARLAVGAWSPAGLSRTKDFGEFTAAELERARVLLGRMPWRLGVRRTRRWRSASNGSADLRPLIRRNLMRGDLVALPRRERRETPRPIVLLGDVSGSMERYTRVLLYLAYGLARSGARVETFVFATTLTRVTRHLAVRGHGEVFARVAREVQDWGGGTRIGDALRCFNTRWARRVMRNSPVVLLISDGWDRGDPTVLGREVSRLRRSCRRLIWLNPLLGSDSYQPLTRGMQAALKYADDFLPVHNIASLEQVVEVLQKGKGKREKGGWGDIEPRREGAGRRRMATWNSVRRTSSTRP